METIKDIPHITSEAITLGAYVHVPFCATTCDFCAFYQEAPERSRIEAYLGAMEREFAFNPPDRACDTVFWGGGTPGLLPAKDLERLGRAMLEVTGQPREWTVEMAPSTVKADKLRVLADLGVTRISMGVQSFDATFLEQLGRMHRPNQIYKAIDTVRAAGIGNLNLDLIFGAPGQDLDAWRTDLQEALRVGPEHISTYCLTFEEDTALWVKLRQGAVRKHTETEEAAFYETAWEVLEDGGFAQYEVSNFARSGFACEHNLNTWRMHEWIGYGPSAASQYHGRRCANPASTDEWIEGLNSGKGSVVDVVPLTPGLLMEDALMFGLRMNEGVDLPALERRFQQPVTFLEPLWEELEAEGYVKRGERLRLTLSGRLLADEIARAVLAKFEEYVHS